MTLEQRFFSPEELKNMKKSLGQIAFETRGIDCPWERMEHSVRSDWENLAQAIASALRAQEPQDTLHTTVAMGVLKGIAANPTCDGMLISQEVERAFRYADAFVEMLEKRRGK